jgi:type IX secretion system PorP/SprF family membrane protein
MPNFSLLALHFMSKTRNIFLVACLTVNQTLCFAQDIHFSQFFHNPLFTGIAAAGSYDGAWRFAGNQRLQWRSVSDRPYNTLTLSADENGHLHQNLSTGMLLFHDIAGDSHFRTFSLGLGGSWNFVLDSDKKHELRTGLQLSVTHRSIRYNDLEFGSQYNGLYFDPDQASLEALPEPLFYADIAPAIHYQYHIDKKSILQAGIAIFNLTSANQSLIQTINVPLDVRFNGYVHTRYRINDSWEVYPAVQFQTQGTYRELIFGGSAGYVLKDERNLFRLVRAGIYYRNRDAGYILAGMEYDQWTAGITYDFNFSKLIPASRFRGGIELAIIYIIRKPELIKRIPYCIEFL